VKDNGSAGKLNQKKELPKDVAQALATAKNIPLIPA